MRRASRETPCTTYDYPAIYANSSNFASSQFQLSFPLLFVLTTRSLLRPRCKVDGVDGYKKRAGDIYFATGCRAYGSFRSQPESLEKLLFFGFFFPSLLGRIPHLSLGRGVYSLARYSPLTGIAWLSSVFDEQQHVPSLVRSLARPTRPDQSLGARECVYVS